MFSLSLLYDYTWYPLSCGSSRTSHTLVLKCSY